MCTCKANLINQTLRRVHVRTGVAHRDARLGTCPSVFVGEGVWLWPGCCCIRFVMVVRWAQSLEAATRSRGSQTFGSIPSR
jgi:hypothetical protein